jgi:hypothetical protein
LTSVCLCWPNFEIVTDGLKALAHGCFANCDHANICMIWE